jgi:DNA-binding transcriptional MocR family regulator
MIVTMTIPGLERVFKGDKPLYLALTDVLAEAIADGKLVPGERLPTHRELSARLGVTTATVTRAYVEAERRGLVKGEVGRGTFVRAGVEPAGRFDFGRELRSGVIDLAFNLPPVGAAAEERALLSEGLAVLASHSDTLRFMHYQPAQVLDEYRAAGCIWLGHCGVRARPEEVVVTAGSQHALFVALAAMAGPGDEVLTEALTYPGLKNAAEYLHLRLRGVSIDAEGVIPEALDAACAGGAKIVYLVPTLHNPTTATMSKKRRRAVAEVIRRHNVTLIEDDIHALLLKEKERPRPLATLLPERTFYVANTAKMLAPALRVSYLRVPQTALERVVSAVQATVWMTPPLGAELAMHWIRHGLAERLLTLRRREATARQALARQALAGHDYRAHPCGYHGWLELAGSWRADSFVLRLIERGVAVTAAETFVAGKARAPQAVRICLGGAVDRRHLADALATVRATLNEGPGLTRTVV